MPHTPGPLKTGRLGREDERRVTTATGLIVAEFATGADAEMVIDQEQRDANARLFIAAEDLLAALKAQDDVDEHFRTCLSCGADLRGNVWFCSKRGELNLRAKTLRCDAIAKATGNPTT